MKLRTILLLFGFLSACSVSTSNTSLKAVYLVLEGGQLSQTDLAKHSEILVTSNFDEFKRVARNRIALWIDKNATQLVDSEWINAMPQASYPIIVIGYNDPLRSFKYSLQLSCFLGPINPDFSDTEPGFSVIERDNGDLGAPDTMLQGFNQTPTVDDILRISNDLLDGKIRPTPSATYLPNIATPTPSPN